MLVLVDSRGADYTVYQLERLDKNGGVLLWNVDKLGPISDLDIVLWGPFLDMFILKSIKDKLKYQFTRLEQGSMPVSKYETISTCSPIMLQRFCLGRRTEFGVLFEVETSTPNCYRVLCISR